MTSQIHIYAELLPNIRQISLAVSLPSATDTSTTARVSSDGLTVHLRHGGVTNDLRLPARVAVASATLPVGSGTDCAWRLPLAAGALPAGRADSASDTAPWSATDFQSGVSEVSCSACRSVVVPAAGVQAWKDLPSENWAEMMEFWHCHKPEHHHQHHHHHHQQQQQQQQHQGNGESATNGTGKSSEQSLAARGYGANSAISAQKGVGFVDLMSLLFAEDDCQGLRFSKSSYENGAQSTRDVADADMLLRSLNVFCVSCRTQLGYFSFRTSSVTLFKWQIFCQTAGSASPTISQCLSATLIATIARSGSAKSLIMPIADLSSLPAHADAPTDDGAVSPSQVLHLWVLNSTIAYASSSLEQSVPAIKLLYRVIGQAEADAMLEKLNSDVQEINLPRDAIRAVTERLEESNAILPRKEKMFKEWKVGLLERWEVG